MNGRSLPAAIVIRTQSEERRLHIHSCWEGASGDACVACIILESRGRAKLQLTELPFHLCIIILLFHRRGEGTGGMDVSAASLIASHVL